MNNKYWIAFSSIEQIDSAFTLKLFNHFQDIEKAFNVSSQEIKNIDGLSIKKAEIFLRLRDYFCCSKQGFKIHYNRRCRIS